MKNKIGRQKRSTRKGRYLFMPNQIFMRADEVAQELGISKSHAYKVIHGLNEELQEKRVSDHLRPCQSGILQGEVLLYQNSKGRSNNGSVYKEEKPAPGGQFIAIPIGMVTRKQTQRGAFQDQARGTGWEREFLMENQADLDMTFKSFVELYTEDMKTG